MTHSSGTLYIVATPIGNLADMTPRAIQILKDVDCVIAEDTRHSKKLLDYFNIQARLTSFHVHNENNKASMLIDKLQSGQSLALISDAGTPLISDPGYPLVNQARKVGVPVIPIPGCCALIAGLSAAGLPTDKFIFEGFLPSKSGARQEALLAFKDEVRTVCFYESPHRLIACLEDIRDVLDERELVIAKELTKSYENFLAGTAIELLNKLSQLPELIKGEFIIYLAGAEKEHASEEEKEIRRIMKILLSDGISVKQAAQLTAQISGCKKKQAYQLGIKLQS